MPFSWESIVSFFSPPASRNTSPSLFSSPFSSPSDSTTTTTTKQTDLPMLPNSAFPASAGAGSPSIPSPAESSSSLAPSDRDYFPPTPHRRPSMSSTSTTSTDLQHQPHYPQRTHTTPAAVTTTTSTSTSGNSDTTTTDVDSARPPAPQRAATTGVNAPLDPLSRTYPKPAHEPSLDEMLARPPLKWSLGHYVRNPRESKDPSAAFSAEEKARRFEEAKKKLLRDKEVIDEIARRR